MFGIKEFGHCANCRGGSILYVKTTFLMALHSSTPVQITCFIEFIVIGSSHACTHTVASSRANSFEASRTTAVGGIDIDIRCLVNLRKFIEEECMAGLCYVEQGGALTHKHFQVVVKGNFSSLSILNKTNEGLFEMGCETSNQSCSVM